MGSFAARDSGRIVSAEMPIGRGIDSGVLCDAIRGANVRAIVLPAAASARAALPPAGIATPIRGFSVTCLGDDAL
jgi:hypothetical protein